MIVCTRCLYRNEDDAAFCVSCGAYLEWSSEKVAGSGPPARAAAARKRARPRAAAATGSRPVPGAPPVPLEEGPDRSDAKGPPGDGARAAAGSDALALAAERLRRRVAAARRQRMGLPPEPLPPGGRRSVPAPEGSSPPQRPRPRTTVPSPVGVEGSDEPTLQPGQPLPQQPSEAVRRAPRQTVGEEDLSVHPGETACRSCGAGNAPSRFFCRRCGTALHDAERGQEPVVLPGPPVRRRWWQRWFHRDELPLPSTPAKPPNWRARALAALPVVLVAGLVAAALGPCRDGITRRLDAARKRVAPRYTHVYPSGGTASSALPDHPAEAAFDRAPNTYWAEGGPTTGDGQSLTVRFDRPFDLGRIGFYNGAQTKPQDFLSQPRLRDIVLVFNTGVRKSLTLKDQDAFQNHSVEAKGVSRMELEILSVYPSPQGGTDATLGEVEFFIKS